MKTSLLYGVFVLLLFSISSQAEESIIINNAWISEAPPVAKVNAGYFSIENKTAKKITLTSVSSDSYANIEMHRSIVVNDTVKMQTQKSISLAPKENLKFTPGGYHLMLFRPVKYFKEGELVDLQFEFSDGVVIPVNAEVRKLDTQHHHSHH